MSESKKEPKKPKFTPDDVDEEIPHPYLELYRHTILRGANVGSLLPLIFAPPILYLRGTRKPAEVLYKTARASMYGVVSQCLKCSLISSVAFTLTEHVLPNLR